MFRNDFLCCPFGSHNEKDLTKSGVRAAQGHVVELFPKPGWGGMCETLRYSELQGKTLVISETKKLFAGKPDLLLCSSPNAPLLLAVCPFCLLPLFSLPQSLDQCVLWLVSRVPVSWKVHFVSGIRDFPWNLAGDITCLHTLHLLLAGAEPGLAEGQFRFYETENLMLFSAISELKRFRGFILQR